MEFWKRSEEREKQLEADRKRLLSISESDALKLPIPERYQRMRYQREIEAYHWLLEVRRKQALNAIPLKKKYAKCKCQEQDKEVKE